jgi:hypothetical protein
MNRGTRSQAAKSRTRDWKSPEEKSAEIAYLRDKRRRELDRRIGFAEEELAALKDERDALDGENS